MPLSLNAVPQMTGKNFAVIVALRMVFFDEVDRGLFAFEDVFHDLVVIFGEGLKEHAVVMRQPFP
jgi:hypothetical protein